MGFDRHYILFNDITLYHRNLEYIQGKEQYTFKQFKADKAFLVFHKSGSLAVFKLQNVQVVQVRPTFQYWKFDSCELPFMLRGAPSSDRRSAKNAEIFQMMTLFKDQVKDSFPIRIPPFLAKYLFPT